MTNTIRRQITSIEDDRISIHEARDKRTEPTREPDEMRVLTLAVLPDEDEDDCLTEATDYVAGLYGDCDDVSSVTCEGWLGGHDGPREAVLVEIRLVAA